jgi:hypothetical protein
MLQYSASDKHVQGGWKFAKAVLKGILKAAGKPGWQKIYAGQ